MENGFSMSVELETGDSRLHSVKEKPFKLDLSIFVFGNKAFRVSAFKV